MAKLFGQAFIETLEERSNTYQTRLIHALDIANTLPADAIDSTRKELIENACHLAAAVAPHVVALKLNYPLVLATGVEVAHHLKIVVPEVPLIADFKVADIDSTNAWIARHTFAAGFDAIIVHGFIGNDAIQAVLDEARNYGDRGVVLVVDMSHPGATQFIHPQTQEMARMAVKLRVSGVIAPGTRPEHVSEIRSWIGSPPLILAPGVGAQGGKPGSAIAAGANYEIIGRTIYQAKHPAIIAKELAQQTFEVKPLKRPATVTQGDVFLRDVALLLDDTGAIKFGSFTLASGKISPYYIDLRVIPSYPSAFSKLTDLFIQWLNGHPKITFDRIAGVPTAGISFATAICNQLNVPLLYIRTKPKKYGRQKQVEGILNAGDHVLVVDDLITDGESKIDAVNALREAKAKITDVIVVVDREQGGSQQLAKAKLKLHSLTKISHLVKTLGKENRLTKHEMNQILSYLSNQK
jgi:uridine monophosphate synthetase